MGFGRKECEVSNSSLALCPQPIILLPESGAERRRRLKHGGTWNIPSRTLSLQGSNSSARWRLYGHRPVMSRTVCCTYSLVRLGCSCESKQDLKQLPLSCSPLIFFSSFCFSIDSSLHNLSLPESRHTRSDNSARQLA